jgi:hypothetical protein
MEITSIQNIFSTPIDVEKIINEPIEKEKITISMPTNSFSEKLKKIGFPKIPFPKRSILIQGETGRGKTLYSKYLQSVMRHNSIPFSLFDEVEYEIESKKGLSFDPMAYVRHLFSGEYIILDQLFNGIARIITHERSYAGYEYIVDQLYQNSFELQPRIIIGLTNRNFEEIPIPADTKRKIRELFIDKEYV